MKEEYNKCCEKKLRTIARTEKENNQNVFYEWENKKFRHGQKTFSSPKEIMKCSEINKGYEKLINCINILQMINEKKLFLLSFTVFITFLVSILNTFIIFIFVTQNLTYQN